jgi:hypothetical protein
MNPSDLNTLKAVLSALSQLPEALPTDIQTKLHEIGKNLDLNPNNIGDLATIAKSYEPLKQLYQKELTALLETAGERSKGFDLKPLSELPTPELTNAAIETFNAEDSVAAAKDITKPSYLKRIWKSIRGKN